MVIAPISNAVGVKGCSLGEGVEEDQGNRYSFRTGTAPLGEAAPCNSELLQLLLARGQCNEEEGADWKGRAWGAYSKSDTKPPGRFPSLHFLPSP